MSSYDVINLDDLGSDKLKMLLHGPQGHGKTTTAISIAEICNTLVIDLPGEKGLRSIKKVPYRKNIRVIRPKSTDQLTQVFWDLQSNDKKLRGTEAVVVESASAYSQMAMRKILGLPEDSVRPIEKTTRSMQIQDWGTLLAYMTDLGTFWYGLADITSPNPLHVIMTCQSKRVEEEDTGEVRVSLDLSSGSRGPMLSNPDYIGYCFIEARETEDLKEPEQWDYRVRFGPHDVIATKIHEDIQVNMKLTDQGGILGGYGAKRLTIPKFAKAFKIPLK